MSEQSEVSPLDPIQRILQSAEKELPLRREKPLDPEIIRKFTDEVKTGMEVLTEQMELVATDIKTGSITLDGSASIEKGRDSIDLSDLHAVLSDSAFGRVRYRHTFRGRNEYRHDLQQYVPVTERSFAAGNRLYVYSHMDDPTRLGVRQLQRPSEQEINIWTEYYLVDGEMKKFSTFPASAPDPLGRDNLNRYKGSSLKTVSSQMGAGDWELVGTVMKTMADKVQVAQQEKKPL